MCISKDETNEMFPNLVRCLHTQQIASLLAMSRLVGTECPGLNSVFSGFDLSVGESKKKTHLEYRVINFDERVNMISMYVDSAMLRGTIKTFIRPEPFNQESYVFHKKIVTRKEFKDQSALVLGGTRGLGEVTCKLLVAGNAKVIATYTNGEKDAKRIRDEIFLNGGNIKYIECDVLDKNKFMMNEVIKNVNITHLYYFPTPYIFSGESGFFRQNIL